MRRLDGVHAEPFSAREPIEPHQMDESGGENGTGGTNRMSMGHRGTLHIDDLELQPELPRDYEAIAAKASLISKR
jgi:hypothetical protein